MNNEKRNVRNTEQQQSSEKQATSRARRRRERRDSDQPVRWVQVRLIPIWLRIVLVLILLCCAAVAGAMIGYGILGEGSPGDIFKKETWNHIMDIINGTEPS